MKNKTFLDSFRCAFRGIRAGFKSEKNFTIYLAHILITLPINYVICENLSEWLIYMVCAAGVFSAECFNTIAERICDYLTKEYDDRIKSIKDIGSAGVLYWGFAFYLFEIIMLIRYFY